MPKRFNSQKTRPEAPTSKNIVTMNPDLSFTSGKPPTFMPIVHERQAADIHAKNRGDDAGRQKYGCDDCQQLKIAVGLVGHP
ncbi:MAG: hypothetical protein PVI10_09135 [Methyloceanibacter sp.]|jgi:hypothetical protein